MLRPAGPDDDEAIRALFAESFPDSPKTRADVMRWQYWENPFAAPVSWVWEDEGRIVSHYAGMPVPLLFAGRDAVGAVGIDAATAPSHRGRGLFERIARAVYDDCGKHGMPATLCFPNVNSLRGFQKAGGYDVAALRTFVLAVDDRWLASRFHAPRPVASVFRRAVFAVRAGGGAEVAGPPDGVDQLWQSLAAEWPYGVRRDGEWWRWRYASKPSPDYRFFEVRDGGRLRAAAVITTREDFGGRFAFLLELLAADRDAARAVVGAVAAAATDVAGLATTAIDGTPQARWARWGGLRPLPRRLAPKPLHFGVADNVGDRPDLAAAPWSVAWGDLDHL